MEIEEKILRIDDENVKLVAYIHNEREKKPKKRRAIVICPGGSYVHHSPREAEDVAMAYFNKGYNPFILYYSVRQKALFPKPMIDLAHALEYIRGYKDRFNIDQDKVTLLGFSAGGHLVTSFATIYNTELFTKTCEIYHNLLIKPNAVIAAYPAIDDEVYKKLSQQDIDDAGELDLSNLIKFMFNKNLPILFYKLLFGDKKISDKMLDYYNPIKMANSDTAPHFIWITRTDEMVDVNGSLKYAMKLQEENVKYEFHIYDQGPHGLSLANENTMDKKRQPDTHIQSWFDLSIEFLDRIYK